VSDFAATLRALVAGDALAGDAAYDAFAAMMDGAWSPARVGAFLAALAAKGETAHELACAARAMRERATHVEHAASRVVDTCGTGGDGAETINVSTAAALVVASCGVVVAKHGNRAASSACGSADVLEALGVDLEEAAELAAARLARDGFAFLFAQRYHPAARAVWPIRRELGIRTTFNLLGPLANPALATHQVIGVARVEHLALVAGAMAELGIAGAVVRGRDGTDEVSGEAPTDVVSVDASGSRAWVLDPGAFGVSASRASLRGGSVAGNAAALEAIVAGERSPRADVVALNAALVLVVAGAAGDLAEGLREARAATSDGRAHAMLARVREPISQECV